jgi:error-prone DNA polymerase
VVFLVFSQLTIKPGEYFDQNYFGMGLQNTIHDFLYSNFSTVLPNKASGSIASTAPSYAELHCLTNFSFQRGASHPEELVERAAALGYSALAITDECSVAGVVRAHGEAKKLGLKLLLGAEFVLPPGSPGAGFKLIVLAHNLNGWGNLCEFITAARRAAPKGTYQVSWTGSDWASLTDCEILVVPPRLAGKVGRADDFQVAINFEAANAHLTRLRSLFGLNIWLTLELLHHLDDALWQHMLENLGARAGVPLVAAGNVHMHVRSRKPLQDVITAVRLGVPVAECGFALQSNAEAHLRSRERLGQIYPAELLANTVVVAERCSFSLDELRYQYPMETVAGGLTPAQTLRQYTWEGASQRYPQGVAASVQLQIEHELALITELNYEMYFLTVHDIVAFARNRHILCQGRGSAANSAVCYCLGVTEVDPSRMNMLFERFISRERNEPPDIDVDFEHQRREEVIQYIYQKYGRDRAAIAATVVTYRSRSAIRDVGMALGLPEALVDVVAKDHHHFDALRPASIDGQDVDAALLDRWFHLAEQMMGAPRHLSQHVGGFVLTQGKLTRLVPVENASMPDRSIIQWDKDDLDAMGLLKVDVLALGMLSAIRRCLDLISIERGYRFEMQDIPAEDPATYDMICQADTVGVFQIESRAQMSMLPRLLPRCFYDLVIEVAIVRPGPIQGGMVHPYLNARKDPLNVKYPSPALEEALRRTLGVPIFQEQVMQIAMLAAGFSAGESDSLRRSMAAWKRKGGVHKFHDRLVNGMVERGYTTEFAEGIFKQIEGFGEYGFPESHAASFALITYVSCWLKHHEPANFLCAMLNSQPLGFYSSSQLVQDAKRHGVLVLPVDVMQSSWDCTKELGSDSNYHHAKNEVRLGLRMVSGLHESSAQRIVAARAESPFISTEDLALRAHLDAGDLKALASADALMALSGHRRQQVWDASALKPAPPLLKDAPIEEDGLALPAASEGEEVVFDYAATGLTLRRHPLEILRPQLAQMKLSGKKLLSSAQLHPLPSGRRVATCGIVTMRQQPQTAKGVVFVTLEDEAGNINVIVWKALREQQRSELLRSRLMAVYGDWQRDDGSGQKGQQGQGEVRHLIARRLQDLTPLLGRLGTASRDFR